MIHNHGTEQGLGLYCPQFEIDGKVLGLCLILGALAIDLEDYQELKR